MKTNTLTDQNGTVSPLNPTPSADSDGKSGVMPTGANCQTQTACICGPGPHRPGCFTLFPRKATRFTAKDADGATYSWFFRYDPALRAWVLGDYTGYIRVLELTCRDSAPRIRAILANHGMTANMD